MSSNENIDFEEVNKFSSHAQDWWNQNGAFKTLHDINPIRLKFIESKLSLENLKILDVGCGGGILTEAMASRDANVIGLDASHENISIAELHAKENQLNIKYQISTAEEFSLKHQAAFDLITCMELLEHVPDPTSLIKACSEMVKPGGHVVFSTINRNMKAYLYAVISGEYLFKLIPRGTHQYKNFIRPSELVNWCKENNLELNNLKGMSYNPILNHCALTNQPDVNYLIDTIRNKSVND